jgi:hypothetical protein
VSEGGSRDSITANVEWSHAFQHSVPCDAQGSFHSIRQHGQGRYKNEP